MRGAVICALWLTCVFAPRAAAQSPRDPPRDPLRDLPRDPPTWSYWAGGLAILANALALDAATAAAVADPAHDVGAGTIPYGVGNLTDLWPLAVGATAVGTLFDREAPRVALEMTAGVVAAAVVGEALKWAVGRERPRTTDDPFRFAPGSGQKAFPSGHTVAAFAVAGAISAETEKMWIRGGALALATVVACGRVAARAHWTSDVVAGAVIGTVVGRETTRWVRGERGKRGGALRRVRLAPVVLGDGVGIGVSAPLSLTSSS